MEAIERFRERRVHEYSKNISREDLEPCKLRLHFLLAGNRGTLCVGPIGKKLSSRPYGYDLVRRRVLPGIYALRTAGPGCAADAEGRHFRRAYRRIQLGPMGT